MRNLVTALALTAAFNAFALTDQEAIEEGMMPVEEYVMAEMRSVLTPGLTQEGVERAAQMHRLVIAVNKKASGPGAQTLTVYENGVPTMVEKISTGREKKETAKSGRVYISATPKGFFRPQKIYRDYHSFTWKADMPNAVFFIGGIAIHATGKAYYPSLGTRASGGCVRTTLAASKVIREKIMDTGRGSREGQYRLVKEADKRILVAGNTVLVDGISRNTGDIINKKLQSWDTVIVVYE